MERQEIRNAIYKKYIVPPRRAAKDYAGVEFELPVVNLKKQAVDFDVIHRLAENFAEHFKFGIFKLDDDGNINLAQSEANGDSLSFDCSYNTLELSFGKESNLNTIYFRFKEYYNFIQTFLAKYSHTLTGMGINPYREFNNNVPIPNERYRMLFHHLKSCGKYEGDFHKYPEFGLFSAANQVQLDVEEKNIPDVINTFNKLEAVKSVLFANSPLDNMLCSRDFLWKKSLQGLNPKNVDVWEYEVHSTEDIVSYIEKMSIYCIMRNGKYINFPPMPLDEYFMSEKVTGEFFNGTEYEKITFEPSIEDIEYLRSFKFEDLTFRGTVEFRSVCTQPVSEIMTNPALHAGLINKTSQLAEILNSDTAVFNKGMTVSEIRDAFNEGRIPDQVNDNELKALLKKIIDLSAEGLRERGYGEEHFLTPLYARAEKLMSPAKQMTEGLRNGKPIEFYIKEYAEI